MKKILSVLTVLLLTFGITYSAAAQNVGFTKAQFEELLGDPEFSPGFSHLRLVGDTFYSLEDDGRIYAWNIHEDSISLFCRVDLPEYESLYELLPTDKKEQAKEVVTHLFSGDNQLWAYNILTGRAGIVTASGVNWGAVSDIKDEKWNPSQRGDIIGGFAQGNNLFFAYGDSFFSLDPASGQSSKFTLPINTLAFQPYKSNRAITWTYNNSTFSIFEIDLLDGQSIPMKRQLPDDELIIGLDYIAENDILYLMTLDIEGNNKIYISRQGTDFEYEGVLLEHGRIINLSEKEYALVQASGISISETKNLFKTTKKVLTIRGIMSFPYAAQNFMRNNPDVLVREQNANFEQEDLVSIIAGDSDVDIYAMFTNRLFKAVKEKGYAMELTSSNILTQNASMMYPVFNKTIKDENGAIVAWPTPFIVYKLMAIDSELWSECFGERAYPKTFIELFETMAEWETDYSDQYDNAVVYLPGTLRSLLFQMVFKYCGMYEKQGEWIDFNTPVFQDSLSAYEEMLHSIDLQRMQSILNNENENSRARALFLGEGLYAENNNFFNPDPNTYFSAWPTFDMDDSPVIEVSFVTLWINRNSHNDDIALRFIESLIAQENSSPNYEYALFMGRDQKVENANYLTKSQELNARKAELKQAMSMADKVYKESFEQAIDDIDFELESLEENRYLITDEGISRYASWVDWLKATSESNYLSQNDSTDEFSAELGNLCDMFVQGAIDKERFISQLNQISKLIYYERISD